MSKLARFWQHLMTPPWLIRQLLSPDEFNRIQGVIAEGERAHSAELRFCIESALPLREVLEGVGARERALKHFSDFRIWDTAQNNGVLLYLLVAERNFEIVADRGLNDLVTTEEWTAIASRMEERLKQGAYADAIIEALRAITHQLVRHFPLSESAVAADRNELPDDVIVMGG